MTDRELMQQALEALRTLHDENMDYLTRNKLGGENNQCMVFAREIITALRERLAQPERTWVELTLMEIEEIGRPYQEKDRGIRAWGLFACAVEEKLKEKNA